jgi:CheY-like chemotaxis protein
MNLSNPIIICDENDEIRLLIKEMLTKHGYFHLMEAHSSQEVLQFLSDEQFLIIHKNLLNETIKKLLLQRENYLIVAQNDEAETVNLAAVFGVKHLISFPYSSKSLVERINTLL